MIKRFICPCCSSDRMVESETDADVMVCTKCGTKLELEYFSRCENCGCYVYRDDMVTDSDGFRYCCDECRDMG